VNEHADQLPERLGQAAGDRFAFDQTLGTLGRYSLVAVTEHTLAVHRLVQAVVRQDLDHEAARDWAGAAVRLVLATFPREAYDVRTWPVCARLLPHALTATGHAVQLSAELLTTGVLLNQAGAYLWARAEFAQARQLLERALAIREAELGPDHCDVAASLDNLGTALADLGDLPAARTYHQRALVIFEAQLGPTHPDTATSLHNLGLLLADLGDLPAACTYHQRAQDILEAQLGPTHPATVKARQNLAGVLGALGEPSKPTED
jgi:tetratricopeptide (TPR) repeat protein